MLLWLAQFFQQDVGPLRVFSFISFRAVFATLTALTIGLMAGPAVIRLLTRLKVGQAVRTDGPQTHLVKSGTPTMGGLLILIAITVSTLLWCDWSNRFIWVVLIVTIGFGIVGWVDDYRKVVYKDPNGMSSREKYFWQSLIGIVAAVYLAFAVSGQSNAEVWTLFIDWVRSGFNMDLSPKADFIIPFFKTISYPLGVHRADLFRHRRDEQCRQSDRWPRRSDDYADHHGRDRTGCVRLSDRPLALFQISFHSVHPGCR